MLINDQAFHELAGRADVYLRFGGAMISRDDLAAIVADWAEARATVTHVIALNRKALDDLNELELTGTGGHGPIGWGGAMSPAARRVAEDSA
jgi:hypothetical protein